ncbi:MAG: DUF4349 domain-containing protein [Erysipelotrichaceae bacterium]
MKKILGLAFVVLFLLAGCAQKQDGSEQGGAPTVNRDDVVEEGAPDKNAGILFELSGQYYTKSISFDLLTLDYLDALEGLKKDIEASGGYIETLVSANAYGGKGADLGMIYPEYNYDVYLTVKIPQEKSDAFFDLVKAYGNMIHYNQYVNNLSGQYTDVKARILALEAEKAALETLLAKATNLSDTIAITQQIFQVQSELESYQMTLKQLDEMIAFDTYTIQIRQVTSLTWEDDSKLPLWTRIQNSFVDGLRFLQDGFKSFLVNAAFYLPLIVLIGIIGTLLSYGLLRLRRKK